MGAIPPGDALLAGVRIASLARGSALGVHVVGVYEMHQEFSSGMVCLRNVRVLERRPRSRLGVTSNNLSRGRAADRIHALLLINAGTDSDGNRENVPRSLTVPQRECERKMRCTLS